MAFLKPLLSSPIKTNLQPTALAVLSVETGSEVNTSGQAGISINPSKLLPCQFQLDYKYYLVSTGYQIGPMRTTKIIGESRAMIGFTHKD